MNVTYGQNESIINVYGTEGCQQLGRKLLVLHSPVIRRFVFQRFSEGKRIEKATQYHRLLTM